MHGQSRQSKPSDYARQLREKQKLRRIFGISEKQMQKYYKVAVASLEESGLKLLEQLEMRFDNGVFRAGLATTRRQARQLVSHGIVKLNGKRMSIPSYRLKEGDIFSIRERNKSMPAFGQMDKRKNIVPAWLAFDPAALSGKVVGKPMKGDLEAAINPQMIIEFYSR